MSDDAQRALLALATVTIGLANYLYTKKKTTFEAMRSRLTDALDQLLEKTRETSEEMQRHLTKQSGRKLGPEMHRLARQCDLLVKRVGAFVPAMKDKIRGAYTEWYEKVFGEGFPMGTRMKKLDPESDRYRAVHTAQIAFEEVVNDLDLHACSKMFEKKAP